MRALLLVAVTAVLSAAGPTAAFAQSGAPPNVVVVMTDDQTKAQMQALPQTRELLGDAGTTFSNYSAAWPLCCPNRASFLTGQYAHNHGIQGNPGYRDYDDRGSLPVALRRAGYHTGLVGKYLNGYTGATANEVPRGWDEWRAVVNYDYDEPAIAVNGRLRHFPGTYVTDWLAGASRRFIERRAPGGPFYLQVNPIAPHVGRVEGDEPDPLPAPRHQGAFAGEVAPRTPAFNEADVDDKPYDAPPLESGQVAKIDARWRAELESLLAVDELVAGLVDALRDHGELRNTVFAFTTDNGYFHGEHRIPGGKDAPYLAASELPLLIRGPGFSPRTEDGLASTVDLSRTILAAANVSPRRVQDGRNLLSGPIPDGRSVLIESSYADSVRWQAWIYTRWHDGAEELYDLEADPFELDNLAGDPRYVAVLEAMRVRLADLRDCAGRSCQG